MNKRFPVELEISSYCPLKCNVCVNKDIEQKSHMAEKDFYYAVDYVLDNIDHISILDISGIGDIFTHPKIEDFLSYIGNTFKGKDIFIIIPTKGTIISDAHLKILEMIYLQGVNISLSIGIFSVHHKKHDLVTGVPGSFNKTFCLILKLKKTRIPFSIELAISQYTQNDVPHFIKLCNKIGVGYEIIKIHSFAGSLGEFGKLKLKGTEVPNAQCTENNNDAVSRYDNFHCARALPTFTSDGNIVSCSHGRINKNYMLGNAKDVLSRYNNHAEFLKFVHKEALNTKICSKCPALYTNA